MAVDKLKSSQVDMPFTRETLYHCLEAIVTHEELSLSRAVEK